MSGADVSKKKKVIRKTDQASATHIQPGSVMEAWLISKEASKKSCSDAVEISFSHTPALTAIWLGSPAGKR